MEKNAERQPSRATPVALRSGSECQRPPDLRRGAGEVLLGQPSGFLLVDKPAGITSHDVVDRVRHITGIRRVGHSGTLDPFATGLLILGVGRATKELGKFQGLPKRYVATMHFGATSQTGDITGTIKPSLRATGGSVAIPSFVDMTTVCARFLGPIHQTPPMYSAKKIGGVKLYELARAGKTIERRPNPVTIHELILIQYAWPVADIEVACSSGTYIRTLVEDIGNALGVGAYCEQLRRTAIGFWKIEEAIQLDVLDTRGWQQHLRALDSFK